MFLSFLYSSSFVVVLVVFIVCTMIVPVDCIVKSRAQDTLLVNSLVVLSAIALYFIFNLAIAFTKVIHHKQLLDDVPKPYIPVLRQDLGKSAFQRIQANFARTRAMQLRFEPQKKHMIRHPGLSPPEYLRSGAEVPAGLVYEDVLRSIGDRLRYGDRHFLILDLLTPALALFKEAVEHLAVTAFGDAADSDSQECIRLYEELRFSGKPILEEQFVRFMELFIDFSQKLVESRGEEGLSRRPSSFQSVWMGDEVSRRPSSAPSGWAGWSEEDRYEHMFGQDPFRDDDSWGSVVMTGEPTRDVTREVTREATRTTTRDPGLPMFEITPS